MKDELELHLQELRARNEERARKMIEQLGEKWLCHPSNQVKKKNEKKAKVQKR